MIQGLSLHELLTMHIIIVRVESMQEMQREFQVLHTASSCH